jgi:hypothetical protein
MIASMAVSRGMNVRVIDATTVSIAIDETTKMDDIDVLFRVGLVGLAAPVSPPLGSPGIQLSGACLATQIH